MQRLIFRAATDVTWSAHPGFPDVRLAWLMRRLEHGAPFSAALVQIPSAAQVPEHDHTNEDDVLYVLRGHATMWVAGLGDIPLSEGSFLRIPAGVRHRPHSFADDFTAFDLWPGSSA